MLATSQCPREVTASCPLRHTSFMLPPPLPNCCCSPRFSSLGSSRETGLFNWVLASGRLWILAVAARHPSVGPPSGGLPLLDTTGASGTGLSIPGSSHSLVRVMRFAPLSLLQAFRVPIARAGPLLRHGTRRSSQHLRRPPSEVSCRVLPLGL